MGKFREFERRNEELEEEFEKLVRLFEFLSEFYSQIRDLGENRSKSANDFLNRVKTRKNRVLMKIFQVKNALIGLPFEFELVSTVESVETPLEIPQTAIMLEELASGACISLPNPYQITVSTPGTTDTRTLSLTTALKGVDHHSTFYVLSERNPVEVVCVGERCYLLRSEGNKHLRAIEMQTLRRPREDHGMIVLLRTLLVLGGWRKQALKSCEQISLEGSIAGNPWEPRADMLHARFKFSPCLYDGKVIICGGYCSFIEEYSIQTDSFHLLDVSLGECSETISLVFNNELLILTGHSTFKFASVGTLIVAHKRENYMEWSQMPPVTWGNLVYIMHRGTIMTFVLPDGRSRETEYCPQHLD